MYQNPVAEPLVPQGPPQYAPPGQPMTPLVQPVPPQPINPTAVPNQPIIINQSVPGILPKFKSTPVSMVCPFCRSQIITQVRTEFNCCNCCFCFCFCLLWLIVQLASDKDLNCTDADHTCPSCNRLIGQYKAC